MYPDIAQFSTQQGLIKCGFICQHTRILIPFLTRTLLQINVSITPENYPCETPIVFSLIITSNVKAKRKESFKNYISWVIYLAFKAVERDTLL